METVVLEYGDQQARWEATIEGCVVEIARQLGDASRLIIDTHEFASPRQAREFVADETRRLLAAGFVARRTDRGNATPSAAGMPGPSGDSSPVADILSRLDSIAPAETGRQHNSELLALIQQDPTAVEPYLVYADWLQERGEPLGHLIALHHGARRNPMLHLAAKKFVDKFTGHLLPVVGHPYHCDWRLGFLDALDCHDQDLARFLEHPCTAVLRQLGCGMEAFAAASEATDLPCLRLLELRGLEDPPVPEAESFLFDKLGLSRLLSLRILSFVDVAGDGLPRLIEKLATEPILASLEILAIQTDYIEDMAAVVAALLTFPRESRPALFIDHEDRGWDMEVLDRLQGEFDLVGSVPSPFAAGGERVVNHGEDYDDGQADLLDRICDRCRMMVSGNDGRCSHCGGPVRFYDGDYGWMYEDDELDGIHGVGPASQAPGDEVCAHDAARDPNFDPAADPDGGVDTRWDAFKDDAFDIDDDIDEAAVE